MKINFERLRSGLLFAAFLVLIAMPVVPVQAAEPVRVLIRNVHLIDREGVKEDALVNILITDGTLEVVTQDEIDSGVAKLNIDAKDGFLLGNLAIGARVNIRFLPLDLI